MATTHSPSIIWKCGTCNERLNHSFNSQTREIQSWSHAHEKDHKADPVAVNSLNDLILVCDFCSTPKVVWSNEVNAINHDSPDGSTIVGQILAVNPETLETRRLQVEEDDPDFTACDVCQQLINAGNEVDLATRSVMLFIKRNPSHDMQGIIESIAFVQSRFWANRTGRVITIAEAVAEKSA